MKKSLLILLLFIWATAGLVYAQSPYLINYQVVLRDGGGNLVTTGGNLGVSIHNAITGGNNLYQENHNVTPNAFGIANIKIGAGTIVNGNFNTIDWSSGDKYIQIYYNGAPLGTRNQLVSVPFALHANNGVPAGTIMAYGGTIQNIPDGWKLCDGTSISRSQFATLFNIVGTQFGTGDNVTTFNLPDLRGRFLRGLSGASNLDPDKDNRTGMNPGGATGNNVGSVQSDVFQSHGHGVTDNGHTHPFYGHTSSTFETGNNGTAYHADSNWTIGNVDISQSNITINDAGGTETRPENAAVLYIIKW